MVRTLGRQSHGLLLVLVAVPLLGVLGIALALAVAPLRSFNALVPYDRASRLVASGEAFGADPRQRLDLYAPARSASRPWPVIMFIHGGAWRSGDRRAYGWVGRALAARGFVVAVVGYRLVPQIRYPAFLADNAAAWSWLRANVSHFGGDPARMVLAGHSAGAYDAAMLALDPRWLGGPGSPDRGALRGWIGLAGPYDFLPFEGETVRAAFAGVDDPRATQPVAHVAAFDPPALLATGSEDRTVRPANSDSLARRLRAVGVPVERRVYPGLAHAGLVTTLAMPLRWRAPVLDDIAAFAHRVTGGGG
ncbi:acetyl esterase/lipase [Endobacter medicaginis]|uniref:Acetyl esterase/lipase n=3 Tax=Endobacter medicaginis TaxID=1181271 RepID=A0A839V020_9PROT|nr:alpha/beta hydrolase [Endobacter medicaginis]MBB3172982.1 acetyl esterase/lipase [Endobacter medicaginis]MCX5475238.1 alpha/beta hydrolase [Endobacter medicaginis]